jgi:serine/threonine-protein kinase
LTSVGVLDLRPGAVLDERFIVERHLGTGGMSHVIAARHVALGRRVALKLLRAEHADNPEIIARFLREARGIARLSNEHVVDVMDVGTLAAGVPFIVMEYLEGSDFEKLLVQRGAFSVPEVIEYALQVLEALSEAHRAGIVRDFGSGAVASGRARFDSECSSETLLT